MPEKKRKGYGFTGERVMDVSVLLEQVLKKNHIDENMHLRTISDHFGDIVGNAVLPHVQLVKLDKQHFVAEGATIPPGKANFSCRKKLLLTSVIYCSESLL